MVTAVLVRLGGRTEEEEGMLCSFARKRRLQLALQRRGHSSMEEYGSHGAQEGKGKGVGAALCTGAVLGRI